MENNKIETLYKMLINGITLNDNTLRVYGFSENEIYELISRRIIAPTSDKSYKLVYVEKLRKYGISLLQQGKFKEADICFQICYEVAPTGKNICLQVMISAIKKGDYQKVYEIFANLEKNHPERNSASNNLYLYLLSIIAPVPEEYIERTRQIESKDIVLTYAVGTKVENEIRKAISQNKFAYACKLINERMQREKDYSVKFELLRALVIEAIEWNKRFRTKLYNLIENEKYEEVVHTLMQEQSKRRLSEQETNILLIAHAIVSVRKTKIIPEPVMNNANNMQEAIIDNNFALALKINEDFLEFNNINQEENLVHILLTKLISVIEDTKTQEQARIKDKQLAEIEELAYYISSLKLPLDKAVKQIGLMHEQTLLIKLIYARDYYIESNHILGDILIAEVEADSRKTIAVTALLEEIKVNRDNYKKELSQHKRKLSQDKK